MQSLSKSQLVFLVEIDKRSKIYMDDKGPGLTKTKYKVKDSYIPIVNPTTKLSKQCSSDIKKDT